MRFWKPRPLPRKVTVAMIVASYLNGDKRRHASLHCLLTSLLAQTHQDWTATVVHDGPTAMLPLPREIYDARVQFVRTSRRLEQFGHPHRHAYAMQADAEVIGFTNDDNYYMPTYFEWLLADMVRQKADFVYCDMVHSHKMWRPMTTRPMYKHLDVGGFLVTKKLVAATPWVDFSFKGDGTYIDALVAKARKVVKVPATLFVHN